MEFSKAQYVFFKDEFDISKSDLADMSDEHLADLYDEVCEIEIEETALAVREESDGLSTRGEVAVEIVNIMATQLGYVQDN
ncbi:MAG: hypothetical protein FWF81_02625 [Defluviitaleaceae bacterium]|nr:hypothetical protein [Defluviitaleaceae bacterium]